MDIKFKFYKVGRCVRDKLLNIKSKDIDFCVVVENFYNKNINEAFELLCEFLNKNNYTIFLKTPKCFTIRAKCHKTNEVHDFVLARKELKYDNDTIYPHVEIGTLYDDLIRRDFTINSLAIDNDTNELIDICNGLNDLRNGILKTPMDPIITLNDDPLRILRGFRFAITKNLKFDNDFILALSNKKIWIKLMNVVSLERIREELDKMFKSNTLKTLDFLNFIKNVNNECYEYILNNISLKPILLHINKN